MTDIVERLRSVGGYFDQAAFENGVSCSEAADEIEALRQQLEDCVIKWNDAADCCAIGTKKHAVILKEAIKQQGEPVAWIRFRSDGCYDGPLMDSQMESVRKTSGAWTPLYTSAPTIPEGWQLVPKEPTTKMLESLYSGMNTSVGTKWDLMLSDAPEYKP